MSFSGFSLQNDDFYTYQKHFPMQGIEFLHRCRVRFILFMYCFPTVLHCFLLFFYFCLTVFRAKNDEFDRLASCSTSCAKSSPRFSLSSASSVAPSTKAPSTRHTVSCIIKMMASVLKVMDFVLQMYSLRDTDLYLSFILLFMIHLFILQVTSTLQC